MQLTPQIHQLQIDFEIAIMPGKKIPRYVNLLLILGENITLIDSGIHGCEKKIFDYLEKQQRHFSEIKTLILSHSHPDHIGSAAELKELTGCEVMAHKAEQEWIEDIDRQNSERPVPGFYNLVKKPVSIDGFIGSDQELEIEKDITLRFIHSPGHSKGSINILFKEVQMLFTADSIPLKNDIPNYDNYKELLQSLKRIKDNTEYKTLLSSWTKPLYDSENITNIIREGEGYLEKINTYVKQCYQVDAQGNLDSCKCVIEKIGLPPFLINPVVDKAFRSHL